MEEKIADHVTQDGAVELNEFDLGKTTDGGDLRNGPPTLSSKISGPYSKFVGDDWAPRVARASSVCYLYFPFGSRPSCRRSGRRSSH